jgi:hypothetical protein
MKKFILLIIIILSIILNSEAAEKNENSLNYIPIAGWEHLDINSQKINSSSMGMIVQGSDLQVVGLYRNHKFDKHLEFAYPKQYHSIEFLIEKNIRKHQFLTVFNSDSDEPVSGGLHTFQAAMVWGYRLIEKKKIELILGCGIGISDFGIEMSNGDPLPVIPLPLIRAKYHSNKLSAKVDFITGPNFNFVIAPESQIKLCTDLRIDKLRDERDLVFDVALKYRFFPNDHPMGDFAGISAGIKNDNLSFDLSQKDEIYDLHYYGLYGEIDFTLLKLTGGHTFKNREMYREEDKFEKKDGFFFAIQALYQF